MFLMRKSNDVYYLNPCWLSAGFYSSIDIISIRKSDIIYHTNENCFWDLGVTEYARDNVEAAKVVARHQ